ncbi:Deuterolysin metalloprotease family-domain-containing protein [Aspergillus ambiguus]|uniref:Deuterolysin metalloprotease family-domain-containing protein n=1 Tax=Aspergillus ambiguus TaxID=176160 RepID=UPI003CCDADB7
MSFLLLFQLLAFLTLAAGKPVFIPRQVPEIPRVGRSLQLVDIKLSPLGNTTVKAEVTNIMNEKLRLVRSGSLFDPLPTRKLHLTAKDRSAPPFTGVVVEYITSHLSDDGFLDLAPKQTVETIFNAADSYQLSPGTEYSAIAQGSMEYALGNNTNRTSGFSSFPYVSNTILLTTPKTLESTLSTRSTLISCTDEYNKIVQDALVRTAEMARAAASDARNSTSSLFQKYFMTNNQEDRNSVADRMEAIATEATTKGKLSYFCQPTSDDYCASNVAAITYPSSSKVVNCPGYYQSEAVSDICGYLDQAAISLHEFTHATAVYSPGTEDLAYGATAVLGLSSSQAMNNADSFAYYASSVYLGCGDADPGNDDGNNNGSGTGNDNGSGNGNGNGNGDGNNNGNGDGNSNGDSDGGDGNGTGDNNGNNPGDISSQLPQWLKDWLSHLWGADNGSSNTDSSFDNWLQGEIDKQQDQGSSGSQQDGGPITITIPIGDTPAATPAPAPWDQPSISGQGTDDGFMGSPGGDDGCDDGA